MVDPLAAAAGWVDHRLPACTAQEGLRPRSVARRGRMETDRGMEVDHPAEEGVRTKTKGRGTERERCRCSFVLSPASAPRAFVPIIL